MPKIKVKGQTVQTGERPQTNGRTHVTHTSTQTHTDDTKRIISADTRSIIKRKLHLLQRLAALLAYIHEKKLLQPIK